MELLEEAACLAACCTNNREDLKEAIRALIDEAYFREIAPSFIDFHLTPGAEWRLTLYGYPSPQL